MSSIPSGGKSRKSSRRTSHENNKSEIEGAASKHYAYLYQDPDADKKLSEISSRIEGINHNIESLHEANKQYSELLSKRKSSKNYYYGPSGEKESDLEKSLKAARYYEEIENSKEARKAKSRAEKEQKEKEKAESEAKELENKRASFDKKKTSRWSKYQNKKQSKTPDDIIRAGGNYIAEDIILNELGKVTTKPLKNAARYAKYKVQDVLENPDVHEGAKRAGKAIGKGLGAIQGAVHTVGQDMMAFGQAKALINGTAEVNEKVVRDKYGNVTVERTFKHNGKKPGEKNTFGLNTPIQPAKEKKVLAVRKGSLKTNKGTLGKRRKSIWDKEEKDGPTHHRRSDVALTKGYRPGIGRHVRSDVELVQEVPTLAQYNEAYPTNDNFRGFEKKSFKGFAKKSFAGFEKKPSFHPINKNRPRANFESTLNQF